MTNVARLTKYFHKSLADESLLGMKADAKDPGQAKISPADIQDGNIPRTVAATLFTEWRRRANTPKGDDDPESIEVWISPVMFALQGSHGYLPQDVPRELRPLWLTASLSPNGLLRPGETRPWLSRDLLSPSGSEVVLAPIEQFDEYLSKHWNESILSKGWPEYLEFGLNLLEQLTPLKAGTEAFSSGDYTYRCQTEAGLVALGGICSNILGGLLHLYERIPDALKSKALGLYKSLLQGSPEQARRHLSLDQELEMAGLHLGHMLRAHPLGDSQRQAMHHFLADGPETVTVVNGPPGTGKTTLLKSVVATLLVQRAVAGAGAGPVIVATSANNQAVTNIIKDFGEIFPAQGGNPLEKRWLPEPLRSLGLYAVSAKSAKKEFPYPTISGAQFEGFFQGLETFDYLARGEQFFLDRFHEAYPGAGALDVAQAKQFLLDCMRKKTEDLRSALNILKQRRADMLSLPGLHAKLEAAQEYMQACATALTAAEGRRIAAQHDCGDLAAILTDLERHCAREPLWMGLLGFIPAVRERRLAAVRADFQFRLEAEMLREARTPRQIRDRLATRCAAAEAEIRNAEGELNRAEALLQQSKFAVQECSSMLAKTRDRVTIFLQEHGLTNLEADCVYTFLDRLDTGLRYELFTLAVHYFEALWLETTKQLLAGAHPRRRMEGNLFPGQVAGHVAQVRHADTLHRFHGVHAAKILPLRCVFPQASPGIPGPAHH